MGNYQAYEKYKDSGVEWLGKIPDHWESKRFKFLLSEPLKYGANEAAEIDDPNLPRYIRITDVKDDGTLREDTFRSLPENIARDYLLEEGDILLARSGATVGKTFIYRTNWGRSAYAGYLIRARVSKKNDSNFIYKFLQSSSYWDWIKSIFIQATIQNVSAEKYVNLFISIPPLDEQETIANFLDRKTKQIDDLIAKKETLLGKLDEKRSAIISHAVTKGLDPTVPMKDSGIEWFGAIPEHWKPLKLKYICSLLKDGTHLPPPRVEQGIPLLSVRNIINDNFVNLEDDSLVSEEDFEQLNRSFKVLENDVLLAIVGATLGKVAIVGKMPKFTIQRSLAILRTKEKLCSHRFTFYFIKSPDFQKLLWLYTGFSAQPGIYLGTLGNFFLLIPPIIEQREISEYLDKKTVEIDLQKAKVQEAIERLKEYRTALITNAVTGKIDVRQVSLN